MINTVEELMHLLKKRDHCTLYEARIMIDDCVKALEENAATGGNIDEAENIVRDYLGLEPDYLDILLGEMM